MKIKSINIVELFGLHNYDIYFDYKENIKIIHAPNGYGKTTVLRLLKDIVNGKFFEVNLTPFKSYRIDFDNDMAVEVIKEMKSNDDTNLKTMNNKPSFIYRISKSGKIKEFNMGNRANYSAFVEGKLPLNLIEDNMPFLRRVGPRIWLDANTGEKLTYDEVINTYGELLFLNKELSDNLRYIREQIPIHIINANRLIKSDILNDNYKNELGARRENILQSVVVYSKELADIIETSLAKSGSLTQELDRTFPARLIQMMTCESNDNIISIERIIQELEELERRRMRLEEVGLLTSTTNTSVQPTTAIDESTIKVLSLYIKDTKDKLNIFNEVERKINLMKEIINKRFINKVMKINRLKGFVFELPDNTLLSPEKLSSGEQNELVLIYELLFKSEPNSLILIDEPEISLHIAWQQEFLNDMLKISEITGINLLIATHSPDIINGRWDLTTGLGEI
ncbi:MAG: AAA family ATPase [Lutisporaceae bacterium]